MATENIITAPFRIAFPEVFEPKQSKDGGKPKYSITMLFPKSGGLIPSMPGDAITPLRKQIVAAIEGKWGADKAKWPANLRAIDPKTYLSSTGKDGWPLRDGDLVEWDGYPGAVFVKASSLFQPGMVNAKLQPIIDRNAVFGGLICRAQIQAIAYERPDSKGVMFSLSNLQILKDDGTVYGGGASNAADAFEAFGEAGGSTSGDDDAW